MSEPTVEITARIALLAAKHLYHLAALVPSHTKTIRALVDNINDAVAEQVGGADLNRALVAASIQQHEQDREDHDQ